MKPLEMLLRNAAQSQKRIVLSEGSDPRVVKAAIDASTGGIAKVILVGPRTDVLAELATQGVTDPSGYDIHDPANSPHAPAFADRLVELRKHRGMDLEKAQKAVQTPSVYAAMMVREGLADGTIGGAVATTAEIVRTAIQVVGTAPGTKLVSSFFLMLFCRDHHERKGAMIFADSGLVVDPDDKEMAEIAMVSAKSYAALTGETPRVAMLSFSTRGSAQHESVSKVTRATQIAREAEPDLLIDGELQFDAAFDPGVAARKAGDSPLKGNANIFVFPDLEAGNIGYKIAQRVGGAAAIGPVMQGLAKPCNDLSRGCTAEDVLHMIAVTAAQAEMVG